ncbi:hypothetical protein L7F22_029738 [Adiantum nelumboides]|nr:hypothetical protein [Adiantum nelumboides]
MYNMQKSTVEQRAAAQEIKNGEEDVEARKYSNGTGNQIEGLEIVGAPLGEGSFGTVFLVRQLIPANCQNRSRGRAKAPTHRYMACKMLNVSKHSADRDLKEAAWELWLMQFLSQRAYGDIPIVRMLGAFESSDGRPCFAMELCKGGSLLGVMQNKWRKGGNMTYGEAALALYNVTRALLFCHKHDILHLDIKPENILLREADTLSTACLGDFGLALPLVAADDSSDYRVAKECIGRGTPGYCAPEVETDGILSMAADTWSLGAVLMEMLTGQLPPAVHDSGSAVSALSQWWSDPHAERLEDDLRSSILDWNWLDHMAQDLLLAMLCPHFSKRISLQQVLSHPWLIINLPR